MLEVTLDNERFVIDGGEFAEGPVARANQIAEAVKVERATSLEYVPDMDLYIGEFIEREFGGKITKWTPLPFEEDVIY